MTVSSSHSFVACFLLLSACPSPLPPVGGSSSTTSESTSTSTGTLDSSTDSGTTATSTGSDDTTGSTSGSSSGGPNLCGNGVIDEEAGEACDGETLPEGITCQTEKDFGKGVPGCSEDCSMIDYTVCPQYTDCGNGEVANGEECDGENLNGHTCDEFPNVTGDGLACNARCELDVSACIPCVESDEECMPGRSACCNPMDVCDGLLIQKECCQPSMGNCPV